MGIGSITNVKGVYYLTFIYVVPGSNLISLALSIIVQFHFCLVDKGVVSCERNHQHVEMRAACRFSCPSSSLGVGVGASEASRRRLLVLERVVPRPLPEVLEEAPLLARTFAGRLAWKDESKVFVKRPSFLPKRPSRRSDTLQGDI